MTKTSKAIQHTAYLIATFVPREQWANALSGYESHYAGKVRRQIANMQVDQLTSCSSLMT
jgi:hypothetical protein